MVERYAYAAQLPECTQTVWIVRLSRLSASAWRPTTHAVSLVAS